MALTDDEKKEMRETMARGIADGLALFRSEAEEEAAKNQPEIKKEEKNVNSSGGLDFAGFLLGRK